MRQSAHKAHILSLYNVVTLKNKVKVTRIYSLLPPFLMLYLGFKLCLVKVQPWIKEIECTPIFNCIQTFYKGLENWPLALTFSYVGTHCWYQYVCRNWWISIAAVSRYLEKKLKRHGRTHSRTDKVKTVYPTTNKVCGDIITIISSEYGDTGILHEWHLWNDIFSCRLSDGFWAHCFFFFFFFFWYFTNTPHKPSSDLYDLKCC